MSPQARQILREYARQCEREKRREAFNDLCRLWWWLPASVFLIWILWLYK